MVVTEPSQIEVRVTTDGISIKTVDGSPLFEGDRVMVVGIDPSQNVVRVTIEGESMTTVTTPSEPGGYVYAEVEAPE